MKKWDPNFLEAGAHHRLAPKISEVAHLTPATSFLFSDCSALLIGKDMLLTKPERELHWKVRARTTPGSLWMAQSHPQRALEGNHRTDPTTTLA